MPKGSGPREKYSSFVQGTNTVARIDELREESKTVDKFCWVLLGPVGFWKPWENFNKSTIIGSGLKLKDQLIDQCNKPG